MYYVFWFVRYVYKTTLNILGHLHMLCVLGVRLRLSLRFSIRFWNSSDSVVILFFFYILYLISFELYCVIYILIGRN
jgi:hypothetical protein